MASPTLVGRTLDGKYRLDELVGSGSMGTVYRATQLTLSKKVAIKVMKRELATETTYAHRFKREAKAASRLDHPNSLRVLDSGDDDGLLYIAMEYLDGQDLLAVVSREWPLPAARIVHLMSQTLAALAVAHDLGIVHRDLKPENVMVLRSRDDEGVETETVKVCDFGVAKLLPDRRSDETGTATGTLTATGVLVGTPEYMSPEQVCGEDLDARSDLYSLGVILYQMLTRHLPFEDKSPIKLAMMQVQQAPKPPSQIVPGIDARIEAVCLKALSKRPSDRYASAREMRAELRGAGAARDSAVVSLRESPPPVSARVVPEGNEVQAHEHAALSAAPTLLAAGLAPPGPTVTQPSAAQLQARKRNRLIALGAIALAVVVLLALAK